MTYLEFGGEFCGVVGELWGRWASKEWNEPNQAVVWEIVRYFELSVAVQFLRQQRFQDPDAMKPHWGRLRESLKEHRKGQKAKTEEADKGEARAKQDTHLFDVWMRTHTAASLNCLRASMLEEIPRLRFPMDLIRSLSDDRFACRVLYLWEKNPSRFGRFRGAPIPRLPTRTLFDTPDETPKTGHHAVRQLIEVAATNLEPLHQEPAAIAEPDPEETGPEYVGDVVFPNDDIPF